MALRSWWKYLFLRLFAMDLSSAILLSWVIAKTIKKPRRHGVVRVRQGLYCTAKERYNLHCYNVIGGGYFSLCISVLYILLRVRIHIYLLMQIYEIISESVKKSPRGFLFAHRGVTLTYVMWHPVGVQLWRPSGLYMLWKQASHRVNARRMGCGGTYDRIALSPREGWRNRTF